MHITASVFINDDERGLHDDYESGSKAWLPTRRSAIADPQAGPAHKAGCTTAQAKLASGKPLSRTKGQAADAHLKRHGPLSEAVVVVVTNGRLDFGTWERATFSACQRRSLWLAF